MKTTPEITVKNKSRTRGVHQRAIVQDDNTVAIYFGRSVRFVTKAQFKKDYDILAKVETKPVETKPTQLASVVSRSTTAQASVAPVKE